VKLLWVSRLGPVLALDMKIAQLNSKPI